MNENKNIQQPFRNLPAGSAVYFIGIGGIGMSAIARYFHSLGYRVSGYDRAETSLTKSLSEAGIPVHFTDDIALADKDAALVVYTPAIPKELNELQYFQNNGYTVLKRSDVLQLITAHSFNICVAGTHGKTTVSAMIAHLLRHSGYGCNAFLGGIAVNYHSNFWSSENNVCVIEADEYDRSFLKLLPDIAVITAMDPDHLDIYGTPEAMTDAFIAFSRQLKDKGVLISKFGLKNGDQLQAQNHLTYSLQNDSADACASDITMHDGTYRFTAQVPGKSIQDLHLNMGGMHNVENMVAAITVAHHLQIEDEKIQQAVAAFKGVKRRFEYVLRLTKFVFIDDYAHHPEELRALILGAKSLFRGYTCTIIFQPHLFSRTNDFAEGFAESLDLADQVVLLPIYPARELPVEGVTSQMITGKMKLNQKHVMTKAELMQWIENDYTKSLDPEFGNILITAGAGDIDALVQPIKKLLL